MGVGRWGAGRGRGEEEETEESLKKAREYDDFKGGRLCSEMFVY